MNEVLKNSQSHTWEKAIAEWEVSGQDEDFESLSVCVCGKTGLRYKYIITNTMTRTQLHPIGSECIRHFGSQNMVDTVEYLRKITELRKRNLGSITFQEIKDAGILSRKFITALYEKGLFQPNKFNRNDGKNDFQFYLNMFNSRSMSDKQRKKADVLTRELRKLV